MYTGRQYKKALSKDVKNVKKQYKTNDILRRLRMFSYIELEFKIKFNRKKDRWQLSFISFHLLTARWENLRYIYKINSSNNNNAKSMNIPYTNTSNHKISKYILFRSYFNLIAQITSYIMKPLQTIRSHPTPFRTISLFWILLQPRFRGKKSLEEN